MIHTLSLGDRRLRFLVLAGLVFSLPPVARAVDADARHAAIASLDSEEIKQYVSALADDTFEGREAGSRGGRAAGIYIVERLQRAGLRGAAPKGDYYQHFGNYHNILAAFDGADPELKDQWIIVSAHYDHVGYGTQRNSYGPIGHIHNGADDNASGVAGLLEIAKALGQLSQRPKRSILLAFWDGEEKGLLGSQNWAEHPTVPLSKVSIMINADMIGRLRQNSVEVYGLRTAAGLRRLISQQNEQPQLLLNFTWEMKADSDHHTFFSRNIPVLMMHTGLHNDYHRPSDDSEKINSSGVKQVAQLMLAVAVELADAPTLPGFRARAKSESKFDQKQSETGLPAPPGRLGIRWDEKLAATGSIVVAAVSSGTAADKGGLKAGDKLVTFAGHTLDNPETFRQIVLAAKNPVSVTVERPAGSATQELSLQLAGEPVRLGIAWRTDDAEPGTVILNRIIPSSPAEVAGLRVNDRVHRINGQEFADGAEFGRLATTLVSPIELEVETVGRIRKVNIPLVEDARAQKEAAPVN